MHPHLKVHRLAGPVAWLWTVGILIAYVAQFRDMIPLILGRIL